MYSLIEFTWRLTPEQHHSRRTSTGFDLTDLVDIPPVEWLSAQGLTYKEDHSERQEVYLITRTYKAAKDTVTWFVLKYPEVLAPWPTDGNKKPLVRVF